MTVIDKRYRFRCYETDGTTVDWTETVNIASVGQVGGQRVKPLDGATSARPWTVEIVDVDEVITARLADANGRAQLLHRLADLSVSIDGGAVWTVKATGRIARVALSGVTAFQFEMQDERLIERNTTIFEGANTTRILPRGLQSAWLVYQPPRSKAFQVISVDAGNDTSTYDFNGDDGERYDPIPIDDAFLDLLEADIVDDPAPHQGNFRTLRANINGTDREIVEFHSSPASDPIKNLRTATGGLRFFKVAGFEDTEGFTRLVYFHMQGKDPSADLPLHLGGREGIDPFTLVKDIYDGEHQSAANPSTVRYDSTRFSAYDPVSNPHGLIDNPRFPKMHFRITGSANMAEWLEENIYGPLGVVPFINAAGEVSPRIVSMPATDQVPDPDALVELTPANIAEPHPSWTNEGREQVTVAKVTFEYAIAPSFVSLGKGGGLFGGLLGNAGGPFLPTEGSRDVGFDLLAEKTETLIREHDRAADIRVDREITVRGIHRPIDRRRFADQWAHETFDRFGDGPIYTDAVPLSTAASPVEGDWVRINLPGSYPALQNQSRTGERVAQVMEKVEGPDGARFALLEGGPNSQPLDVPTISLAANSNSPENAIDVTITDLNAGEGYEVHLAVGASEPDEEHPDWQYRHVYGDANETVTVRGLPSGSTIWGRVRATAPNRFRSDWSTADSQATTGLAAPNSVSDSDVTGDEATITWPLGEADFDVMVDLILTSGGAQVKDPVRLPAGTTRFRFGGLELSTGYTARVWHVDDYGGESSKATVDFTTTGTAITLPAMRGIAILVGASA